MRIRYVANVRIPTHRAHGLQIMKTCEALVRAGADVELIVPRRRGTSPEDPYVYYGVKPIFTITYLPTIEFRWRGYTYAFALQTLAFTLSLACYLRRHQDDSLLYMRGELGGLLPLMYRTPFLWENHIRARKRRSEARAVRHASGIVVVTERYRNDLIGDYKLSPDAVAVIPDGVDIAQFAPIVSKEEARRKLNVSTSKVLAIYVGSDLPWKGLRTLREAGTLLPAQYQTIYIGPIAPGHPTDKEQFVGMRPPTEIPLWLAAADTLVLTGDSQSETARYYTSPLKLFEYMAARRPIVATDLPSYRDILSDKSAILVAPGAHALADGIVHAVEGANQGARVEAAWESVQAYSWDKRAERLLAFMRAHGCP